MNRLIKFNSLYPEIINCICIRKAKYKIVLVYQAFFLGPQSGALSSSEVHQSYPSHPTYMFECSKAFYGDLKQTKADPLDESA